MAAKKKTTEVATAKETVKKAPTRKTTKTVVYFEMDELSVTVPEIQKAVKAEVKAKGLTASALNIYINVAEKAAYYTVDGVGSDEYKVDLTTM